MLNIPFVQAVIKYYISFSNFICLKRVLYVLSIKRFIIVYYQPQIKLLVQII